MDSRTRILKAMNMEYPDRVPLMCQFSIGFMNQQLKDYGITPMELWLDANRYAEALCCLRELCGFDGILASVHGHHANWKEQINRVQIIEGIEVAYYNDRMEKYPDNDLPSAQFFDETKKNIEEVNPDHLPDDLDYLWGSADCLVKIDSANPYRVFDELEVLLKKQFSIHGEVSSPLDYLLYLVGFENALMAMLLYPEKCKLILQKFANGVIKMAKGLCRNTDIDAIKISSPFAGMGFISPEQYREFEHPYVSQIVKAVKEENKHVYIHTCGHINDRLELIRDTGITGLECLDPPPIGNVELEDAFKRIGKNVFIKGNIDSVNTLLNASEEKLVDDVKKIINTGMANKGFILSTACSIAPKVSLDRIQLLHRMVKRYGYY